MAFNSLFNGSELLLIFVYIFFVACALWVAFRAFACEECILNCKITSAAVQKKEEEARKRREEKEARKLPLGAPLLAFLE